MEHITISDFSGGLDDDFLSSQNNCFSVARNFYLNSTWKLIVRPGTYVHPTRIPGAHRVSGIYIGSEPFGDPIVFGKDLVHSTTYANETKSISGITRANPAVVTTTLAHGYGEDDLIYITGVSGMTEVNGLRFAIRNVTSTTFELFGINSTEYTAYTSGGTVARATWTEIQGPGGNSACPSKTATDLESAVLWRKQVVYASSPSTMPAHRLYCSSFSTVGTFQALTLGLPALASSPILTPDNAGSTYTYVYSFHYYYQFTDYDGTTFDESGPITSVSTGTSAAITSGGANDVEITSIPTLANTAYTNYDVSTSLKIRIYRTVNGGTTSYLLGTVNNGTTVYTDAATDSSISDNDTIYTDGGVLENIQPPTGARFVTQVNDYFWFATQRLITHSKAGAPGACPSSYQQPTDQLVRGLGSVISYPILMCDRSVYRIEGNYDEFGDGGFFLREIHKTAGCASNRSIVSIPGGIAWAGNDGFYFTDGYNVVPISDSITRTSYPLWKSQSIVGVYNSDLNLVHWTIDGTDSSQSYPIGNAIACLHLDGGIKSKSVFTTWDFPNNIYPCAVGFTESFDSNVFYRNRLIVGDALGYLFYTSFQKFTDYVIDTTVDHSLWKKRRIDWRYESPGLDFGSDSMRKYCTEISAEFQSETDCAVQFITRRNDGGAWGEFSEIRNDGLILWGITEAPWNNTTLDEYEHYWNSQPILEGRRHFPSGQLRCTRRQIGLQASNSWITRSDLLGTATVNGTTKTVTLDDATYSWPSDCEEYEIGFEADSYTAYWVIKTRDSDTQITVNDPGATLSTVSTSKWQMRGKRKFERPHLLSYTIYFKPDDTQSPSRGTASQQNA